MQFSFFLVVACAVAAPALFARGNKGSAPAAPAESTSAPDNQRWVLVPDQPDDSFDFVADPEVVVALAPQSPETPTETPKTKLKKENVPRTEAEQDFWREWENQQALVPTMKDVWRDIQAQNAAQNARANIQMKGTPRVAQNGNMNNNAMRW